MRPKILFLTNPSNDGQGEDAFLAENLSDSFDLIITDPGRCFRFLQRVDGVFIRNIWPTHEIQETWETVKATLRESKMLVYNPLTFRGDIEGKRYLLHLYEEGFPVIPSVDAISNLHRFANVERFWIKPEYSCDGFGAEELELADLLRRNPKGYIIQPFMTFDYEPSFFFVDNQFHHAIRQKHRLDCPETQPYSATADDIKFAKRFVYWGGQAFGTQRIDAIRTKTGELLLTEIENLCPYLYMLEIDPACRDRFLMGLKSSMISVFTRHLHKAHEDDVVASTIR